jgi:hypothetical protein
VGRRNAGAASIGAGLVQGMTGEPTTLSRILTIIGPTVITLWLLTIGVLMARKASDIEAGDVVRNGSTGQRA